MDMHPPVTDEPSTTTTWDWGDLLDLTAGDQFTFSLDSDYGPSPAIVPESPIHVQPGGADRVRKRDPRLVCENFLAGRIPCACPEMDEKLEEEEDGGGKKRARKARATAGMARCQVPGCEADISELKGYHRRHRVCLRCANATTVVLDGLNKRYCQQCGKFHILSDFDEGKRSCRRKLERHNNRRRRKPVDSKGLGEKEPQEDLIADDVGCDIEAGIDNLVLSNQIAEGEALLESEEGHASPPCSAPGSQNIQSDSVVSFMASDETQTDGGKDNCKYSLSSSYIDNKSAYSSMCPTGRISFKLYDWNPAEFPRRLRHQIFQWLASMPVELEGYIRPGCTILTVFIAMPKFMWAKLFEDPASHLHDFLIAPGTLLSGRGTVLVYLNNMVFRVLKDGTSVMKVKPERQVPRLHYVHPSCFEAGKPMEFVACGSNLRQPKFRFLVSFAGKYLRNDYDVTFPHGQSVGDTACSFDHQLFKINVPCIEQNFFGPAFIEVENESGLSNFIPILIGDEEICSEMNVIQQRFGASLCSEGSLFAANLCEVSALSEFILDIAWLLKDPASESIQNSFTSSQIRRYNCLLNFLISHDSTIILKKVLQSLKILMGNLEFNSPVNGTDDTDMRLFQNNVDHARDILCQKLQKSEGPPLQSRYLVPKGGYLSQSCSQDQDGTLSTVPISNQDMEIRVNGKFGVMMDSTYLDGSETFPLLNREVVMNVKYIKEWPRKSCSRIFSSTSIRLSSRPAVFVIATVVVCFGICAVLFHPQKVGKFAVSIRRCLFDKL